MEDNLQGTNLFKGQINEKTFFEIFGFPKIDMLFNISNVILLVAVCVPIFFLPDNNDKITATIKISIVILAVIVILLSYLIRTVWKNNFRKNLFFKNEIYGNYNEDKIEWNAGSILRIILPWENVQNYMLRKKGIVLFYNFDQKVLIHKSFFENEDKWLNIRRTVKSKVSRPGFLIRS